MSQRDAVATELPEQSSHERQLATWRAACLVLLITALLADDARQGASRNVRAATPTSAAPVAFRSDLHIDPSKVHIMSFDSRPIRSGDFGLPTVTAAANLFYSRVLGADFAAYYAPPADPRNPRTSAACTNSRHGTQRSPPWCKLLAVWLALRSRPHTDYIVFIDSDAVFRRTNASTISRHVEKLSSDLAGDAVIGFLWNPPTHGLPSTGYFFLKRSQDLLKFLWLWWNTDERSLDLSFPWEQGALNVLLEKDEWVRRSMLLLYERQYALPTSPSASKHIFDPKIDEGEQVIFHGANAKIAKLLLAESALGIEMGISFDGQRAPPENVTLLHELERSVRVVQMDVVEVEKDLQAWRPENFPLLQL